MKLTHVMDRPQDFRRLIKSEYAPGGVVDIEKILDEGTETAVWCARLGKAYMIKFLIVLISDLRNSFNVSRPMNEGQIIELAEDFINDLWFIKFEEFPAFFEGIRRGTIGKVYERLDGPLIWEFWDIYATRRMETIEARQAAKVFIEPSREKTGEEKLGAAIEKFCGSLEKVKELKSK